MRDIRRICEAVGKYHGVPTHWFMNERRSKTRTRCRRLSMALTREMTGMSYPEIAEQFGYVPSHCVNAYKELKNERDFQEIKERLER